MNREFSINVLILVFVNFLVKPFYIFYVEAGVQNLVGPETFGVYFVLFDFVFLFLFLNDAGIQNYNARTLASMNVVPDNYLSQIIGFKLILSTVFMAVTILAAWIMGYLVETWTLLLMILGVFVMNSIFVLLRSSLSSLGYYRWDSVISALDKMMLAVVLGYLVFKGYRGGTMDLRWYPLAQLIVAGLVCIIAVVLLRETNRNLWPRFDIKALKSMLIDMAPFALILLFSAGYNRADAVMLDRLLDDGPYQAGLYAAAYRFVEAGSMVGFIFASLLLPMFTRLEASRESVGALFTHAYKVLWVVSITGAVLCVVHAESIYSLMYVEVYQQSSSLMQLLMWSFIPVSVSHVFGSLLIAQHRLVAINIIFIIGFVLNIILNLWLIPNMKAVGAVWATLITQYFLVLGMMYYVHRFNPRLPIKRLLWQSVLGLAVVYALAKLLLLIGFHWWIQGIVLCTFVVIIALWVGWLPYKYLNRKTSTPP